MPATIEQRYRAVLARIAAAEHAAGRAPGEVRLVAASKQQSAAAIRALAALGHRAFGENYLDEAANKQRLLVETALEWHFIGHVQSNKTAGIAHNFAWVHSVGRGKIARRLSEQRASELAPLNVCLQVNVDNESGKSGVAPADLAALAHAVAALPRLRLRGLMAIPRPESEPSRQRMAFATLRRAQQALNADGLALDVLSMGMTGDLDAAIAEGATHVRIGTALFGPRPAP